MSALKPYHGTTHEAGACPLATLPPRIGNSCPGAGLTTTLSSNHTSTSEHHSCTYVDSNPYATADESESPATPPLTAPNVIQRRCDFRSLLQWLRKAGLELKSCPFPVRLAFVRRPINAIKTVVSSFGKMTIVLSMVLATIYSIPAWRGLQLQAWTSRKDYYEYCQSEMVHLVGTALKDCNKAVDAGLSAPPGYTKRDAEQLHVPLKLRTRQELVEEFSSTGRVPAMTKPTDVLLGKAFMLSVVHIVLMWLFWFVVFMIIITQARKARRHLLAYRHDCCSSPRRLLVSLLPIASMIITAWAVIIMIEDVRWLQSKQLEADITWQQYCNTLSEEKRPHGCISDGPPHHARIDGTFDQAWYTGPLTIVVLACFCALVILSAVERNAAWSARSLSNDSALPLGQYATHRDVEGFDEVTNRPRTGGMSQDPTEIPLHNNYYVQENLQLKDEDGSSIDNKGKGQVLEARHPSSTVYSATTNEQTHYSGASTFSKHAPSSQTFYDDEYLDDWAGIANTNAQEMSEEHNKYGSDIPSSLSTLNRSAEEPLPDSYHLDTFHRQQPPEFDALDRATRQQMGLEPTYTKRLASTDGQPCACPFQKMYPLQHDCKPKANTSRLKEHIRRKHLRVFCDCWAVFDDEGALRAHLRANSCTKSDRVDYSQGITSDQEKELKSKRKCKDVTEEEQWGIIFHVVFPNHLIIPSSKYEAVTLASQANIVGMVGSQSFRQRLGLALEGRNDLVDEVCRVIMDHSPEDERPSDEASTTVERFSELDRSLSPVEAGLAAPTPQFQYTETAAFDHYTHVPLAPANDQYNTRSTSSQLPAIPELSQRAYNQPSSLQHDSGFEDLDSAHERIFGDMNHATPFRQDLENEVAQSGSQYNMTGAGGRYPASAPELNMGFAPHARPLASSNRTHGSIGANNSFYDPGTRDAGDIDVANDRGRGLVWDSLLGQQFFAFTMPEWDTNARSQGPNDSTDMNGKKS